MKTYTSFKTLLASIALTVVSLNGISPAFAGGATGLGGGDPIEAQFQIAKKQMIEVLVDFNHNQLENTKLSESSTRLLKKYAVRMSQEINCSPLIFDHKETKHFVQENGSETAFETSTSELTDKRCAPIKIRTKVLEKNGSINIDYILPLYAHEIGHHIKVTESANDEEGKADTFSGALIELFYSRVKFPELVNLSGQYIATEKEVCRNNAFVNANPFSGRILVLTSTSKENEIKCAGLSKSKSVLDFNAQYIFIPFIWKGQREVENKYRFDATFGTTPDEHTNSSLYLQDSDTVIMDIKIEALSRSGMSAEFLQTYIKVNKN